MQSRRAITTRPISGPHEPFHEAATLGVAADPSVARAGQAEPLARSETGVRCRCAAGRVEPDDHHDPLRRPERLLARPPREGRLMLSIVVLEFFGTGLVLPFNVVYLHEVRDFALSDVGLLLGLPPLMGLLVVGPGRLGHRPAGRAADPDRRALAAGGRQRACSRSPPPGRSPRSRSPSTASRSACPGRPGRAWSPRSSRPSSASATSGSTSPCSTSASASAA